MGRHIFLILFFCIMTVSGLTAQTPNQSLEGQLLINVVDVGATERPHKLFLADTASGRITELLVQNQSFFASWVRWSPDGRTFAYLASARRGEAYELWLADANVRAPNPRPPLFELGLNVVTADWNPRFNFIAVGTGGTNRQNNGIYLVNANFENVVFVTAADIAIDALLDWTSDGALLAYGTSDNQLQVVNTETETTATLVPLVPNQPRQLPFFQSGWFPQDIYYVYTDITQQTVYAVNTESRAQVQIPEPFTNPYEVAWLPATNQLLTQQDNELVIFDISTDNMTTIAPNTTLRLTDSFGVMADNRILVNGVLVIGDQQFAECMLIDLRDGSTILLREAYPAATWAHTICQVLPGREHIAVMTTDDLSSFELLPPDLLYSLYILPLDLTGSVFLTQNYTGFGNAPLAFSARWQQVIFQEENDLVVYNLNGNKLTLVSLRELDLVGDVARFEFYWQP